MSATSRTDALTAIAPLAPRRLWWCRIVLPVLRILAISSSLARLRSIHFGGWIVFGDLPGAAPPGWRSRPGMLFLSDYDGDPTEYLSAFGIAAARGMRVTFGSAEDFPGTRPTWRFVDYVQRRQVDELLSYSAYPERTVRDVDTALAVSERVDQLLAAARDDVGDVRLSAALRSLVDAVVLAPEPPVPGFWPGAWQTLWHRSTVNGVVVVVPVEPGRGKDVSAAVQDLARADVGSPFEQAGGVHFARLALLQVAGRSGATAEFLLLSAWVDGSIREFVRRLVGTLGDRADALLGDCPGYPGAADATSLARWIDAHRLPISLFFGCRSGVSVAEVRTAVERWERAVRFVDAVQGRDLATVRRELGGLWT